MPYAYNPVFDEMEPPDVEDNFHDAKSKGGFKGDKGEFLWGGILNIAVLLLCSRLACSLYILSSTNVLSQPSE